MNKKILIFILPLIILILATIVQLFINNGLYNASLYASNVKDDHRDLKIPKPILEGHNASNVIDGHKDTFWNGIDPHRTRDFIDISWDEPIRAEEIRVYFGENRYGTELKITTPIEEIKIKNHNSTYFSQRLQPGKIKTISFKVENTITEDKITRIDEIAVLARAPNIFVSFSMVFWGLLKQYWLALIFYFLASSILLLLGKEYAQKYSRSLFHNLLLGSLFGFLFLLFIIKNQSFENFVILNPYSLTLFLGQLLVIFAILFWPGRAIMELLFKDLSGMIKNAASFGISIFIMAILAVLSIKFDQVVFIPYVLIILPVLSLVFLATRRVIFALFIESDPWKTFGLAVLFTVVYQFSISTFYHFFNMEAGYLIPYGVARIFHLGIDPLSEQALTILWWHQIDDRTPLLGLIHLNFMKLFDNINPMIYVKLALITPLLFFFPLYYWLKDKLSNSWIKIVFIIILVNPYIIYFNIEQPNRFFTFYFLLLFYLFLIKPPKEIKLWQSSILSGVFGGLAFLTHLYATAFIAAGYLYKAWQKPAKSLWLNIAISFMVIITLCLPWYLWVKSFHHGGSMFMNSLSKSLNITDTGFWKEKWLTLSAMFVYYDQGRYQLERFFTSFSVYRYNFIQAATFSLTPLVLMFLFKSSRRYKKEFFFLFVVPILILIFGLSHGWPLRFFEGISHVQPLILYLVVAGIWFLSKIKNRIIQYLFLGLFMIEHFYAIWFLQWDITEQCDICHPWHFADVKSIWMMLPLIVIYALIIINLFKWIKGDNNENLNHSSDLQ